MSDQPPTTVRLPLRPSSLRIAIIGESLASLANPLEGAGAQMLANLLSAAGISPEQCLLAAVCPTSQPPETVKWASEPVQANLPVLRDHLTAWQPHFCILLGNLPLWAFLGRRGAGCSVDDRRGYLFESSFLGQPVRCVATYPPNRIFKEYGLTGVTKLDLRRALTEARSAAAGQPLRLTESTVLHQLDKERILAWIAGIRANRTPVSLDIEGGVGFGPSCIGFAANRWQAIVVPFYDPDGRSLWSEEDEIELWEAVAGLLEDPLVPKCLQNALYEGFVLGWTLGIVIHGLRDDTMLKHFELYCELEKSLEFQASIYTRRPYWKIEHKRDPASSRYVPWIEGRRATAAEWFTYNGLDCCITQEINEELEGKLAPKQREHYQLNVRLLQPVLYMMLRGLRYDRKLAKQMLADIQQQIYELQDQINREAAKSPSRAQLAAFYQAIDTILRHQDRRVETMGPEAENVAGSVQGPLDAIGRHPGLAQTMASEHGRDCEQRLLPLLTAAFCPARLTEKRQVEEISWQPHKWNGKRWVKAGKRLASLEGFPSQHYIHDEDPGTSVADYVTWLKPVKRVVERSFSLTPTTLDAVLEHCKDSCQDACKRALKLVRQMCAGGGSASHAAACGELATLLDLHVKINATNAGGDAQWYLYEHCALPPQFKKEGNHLTDKLASDDEAIIKAWVKTKDDRALLMLKLRRLMTRTKSLAMEGDLDGRLRFGFNVVGTPTGRMAAYGSPTGTSDLNPQTVTKSLRCLFPADEDCELGQSDLDGSDSYTVAAYCASLGDSTMLEDNLARVKPAKVLALIYKQGVSVNALTRDELKKACKQVDGEGWLYFACKRVLHGSNYGMGRNTMSDQILTDSFKLLGNPVHVPPATCDNIQKKAFFARYPGVRRWHDWMTRELKTVGQLTACNGFQRRFYGRKTDHGTLKEALAHMPQVLTTYTISRTLLALWDDPENRRLDGSLRVEPLLPVHDSILKQWRKADRAFAERKIRSWFRHEMLVNGVQFIIPANSTCGPDWMRQGAEKWAKEGGEDLCLT